MKKFTVILVLLLTLGIFTSSPFTMSAFASSPDDFIYVDSGTSYTITGYTGPGGDVVIPETYNGKPVDKINPYVFTPASLVTSVEIHNNITNIPVQAIDPSITIKGYSGSAAHTYATTYGNPFVDLGAASASPATGSTKVNGVISSTVIDCVVPLTVSFAIDPNTDSFVSPRLKITNNTNAPVNVTIVDFKMDQDTINKGFQSVAPDTYTDTEWKGLNKTDSKKLAIGTRADTGWAIINNGSTLYDKGLSNVLVGAIAANSDADMVFEAKHGNSFEKVETVSYTLSFKFELQ